MRINDFCQRLYERKVNRGPLPSAGVSKEMREFLQEQLAKANEEALRLKQDEKDRKEDQFIPYHQINCDEDCMALFSLGPSMSTLQRKDQTGILPNDTDQQYVFFYGWTFLAFAMFVVFAFFSSYPNEQNAFTLSVVFLVFCSTLYLLLKD
jgi:hypothetical protein